MSIAARDVVPFSKARAEVADAAIARLQQQRKATTKTLKRRG